MADITLKLALPACPDFLQIVGAEDDAVIDIAHVPEMQLRALGEEWTAQLIEEARIRAADIQGIPSLTIPSIISRLDAEGIAQ